MGRRRVYFNVRPRYTAGSPAMVPEDTARRVVEEEKRGFQYALSGVWGLQETTNAALQGLKGIVERRNGTACLVSWSRTSAPTRSTGDRCARSVQ